MRTFDSYHDPFAYETLLSLPALSTEPSSAWRALDLDEHCFDGIFGQPDVKPYALQDLRSEYFQLQIHDTPLPEIESASVSSAPSDVDDIPATNDTVNKDALEYDEDIWTLRDVTRPRVSTALTSWDHFLQPSHVESKAAYLSEAGPAAFDAVLEQGLRRVGKSLPSKIVRPDKFIDALFELGCGRESGLFQWQKWKKTFEGTPGEFGLLGTSQDVQDALIETFNSTGSSMRRLNEFNEENAGPSESQCLPIALSSAISVVVYAVMRILEEQRHSVRSLPQLQELFHKPHSLIEGLTTLVKITRSKAQASEIIIELMNETQQLTSGTVWVGNILSEIVIRAATPWTNNIANFIGISPPATRDSRGVLDRGSNIILASSSRVLPPEIMHLVTECETSVQLLQVHQPDHPLLTDPEAGWWPSLSWECSWEAIEKLQSQADEYERSVKKAIKTFTQGPLEPDRHIEDAAIVPPTCNNVLQDPDTGLIDLDSSIRLNQHLGREQRIEGDRLDELVSKALSTDEEGSFALAPPLKQTLTFSIFPLIKAQHRLLSCSVLYLLFKGHGFRSHLRLHHQFQLLGNGSFATRLSQALFDPDQSSGEGRRKGQGKTGLRLQTRETWPPASSELRLVLMGVLSESFKAEHVGTSKWENQKLSDAMSFAIRDLSDVELEKCRDADSIHALDFLRLQYKPPSALLETVLTSSSQNKYDRIFKHLLLLLRVRSVAVDLVRSVSGRNCKLASRPNHRFRLEMQFFVSTLAEYSTNVAVGANWARVEGVVDKVEKCLNSSDFDRAITVIGSLQGLTDIHDEALNYILRALCLDRKQVQVRELLEDIFGLILRFAAVHHNDDTTNDDRNEKVETMCRDFRKQVGRFVRYLQAQSDASTSADATGNREALAFEQLLVRLNMFGYYS